MVGIKFYSPESEGHLICIAVLTSALNAHDRLIEVRMVAAPKLRLFEESFELQLILVLAVYVNSL